MKKQAVLMKQAVAPLQANEVSIIRRKLATFDVKQHEFREKFRKTAPFAFDSNDIYVRIDGVSKHKQHLHLYTELNIFFS